MGITLPKQLERINRRMLFMFVVVAIVFYVIFPQLPSFKYSLTTVRHADFALIGLGAIYWLATYLVASLVYKLIATQPLPYMQILLIQIASGFTNRLVPAGAGAIAVNSRYLVKRGFTLIQASALVLLNNLLGFISIVTLFFAVAIFSKTSITNTVRFHASPLVGALAATIIAGTVVVIITQSGMRNKIDKTLKKFTNELKKIFHRPVYLTSALAASMAITTFYAASLYAVGLAFNVHLSVFQTLFVFIAGVTAATITPTPGGLGGAEAGLVAVFISFGVSPHQALSTALTYRFITYWLPLLPGFVCFQVALRRNYI